MRSVRRHHFLCLIFAVLIGSLSVFYFLTTAFAAPVKTEVQGLTQGQVLPDLKATGPIVGNEVCLGCHGQPGLTMTLVNGDVLDLYVNPDTYVASIHGQDGYACVQCHTNLGNYPHPAFTAIDLRDTSLILTKVCDRCHSGEYNLTMDSVHAAELAIGVKEAAVCTDCHGSHDVHQWTDAKTGALLPSARLSIPTTCSKCHNAIYQKYRTSVHGAALTDEANSDVPTCIDCHGVHNIGNPTTAAFRLKSPELCAGCHTNPAIMDKYGISTDVLNTYVADFHGTTVTLFEKQSPDAPTNKPVCYDCHGIHDISRVDDPKTGIQMQQNLLVRCKVCHPDASSNFPSAWMSHYIPSPAHYSLVFYVNLFYKFFIPLVLGGMVVLVGMDVGHSVFVKTRRNKPPSELKHTGSPTTSPPEQPTQHPLTETQSAEAQSLTQLEQPSQAPQSESGPVEDLTPPSPERPNQPPQIDQENEPRNEEDTNE
jgi:nitrate/TMAO reductase-like tetraheme cytochrome c subunit